MRRVMALFRGLCVAVFAASLALVAVRAKADTYQFNIALATGPDSPQNVVAKQVAAAIVKDTGGRVAAKVFDSGQLGQTTALLQAEGYLVGWENGHAEGWRFVVSALFERRDVLMHEYIFVGRLPQNRRRSLCEAISLLSGIIRELSSEPEPNPDPR